MLSTQEIAQMLGVAETTVKRWSDEDIIACVKTPGGHRKFRLEEVTKFAERNGYTIHGTRPPPMTAVQREKLEVGVHTRDYARIASVFEEEALQADENGLLELLVYLNKHQIQFPVIADEVIRPAFESIGVQWEQGKLEISEEHAASHALTEALTRMASEIHKKNPNGMRAICACPEGELHENGLRSVSYSLENEGWIVSFIGANTPFGTLESLVKSKKPELVCLSVTHSRKWRSMAEGVRKFGKLVKANGGRLVVGGYAIRSTIMKEFCCDYLATSSTDMIAYVRDAFELKPGPKKRHSRDASRKY